MIRALNFERTKAMENKTILWNVRISKTEKKKISELAKRLKVKESKAFRYALFIALESTDPKRDPRAAINNTVVIM